MLDTIPDQADYHGCFSSNGWLHELHPESWDHPARVAFGLSERIYQEALEKGWLAPGMQVLDPFCGVGGFAFHALLNGMHFTGIEIEQDYLLRCQKNFDLWDDRYAGKMPKWGTARVILGDSLELDQYVQKAEAVISSPTYCQLTLHNPHPTARELFKDKSLFYDATENYGKAAGQTGNMKPDPYWQAQEIVAKKLAKVLNPEAFLIWIVKDYVRNKKLVHFSDQWAKLYQRMGYELIAWRRAWQLEENGVQLNIFGGNGKKLSKDHRSLFRARHARMFPELAINFETVLVVRRKKYDVSKAIQELGFD